ncbi:MAG: hypothetical protein CFE43_07635 [Burkholderiales bacterium PBB3]|nr:MAG: hypothetical protein CFE43_07635 [Burkholderiales bacterium PBB3]
MNWRQTPDAQIAQVLLRSVNPQDARWLYFAISCVVVLAVAGGGIASQWGTAALIKSIIGLIIFCLQFVGVGAFTVLMRLNHSIPSRLVPGYVSALRRTAIATWLGVCLITGLAGMLDEASWGQTLSQAFGAGAVMLLISTPMRWPLRWCIFMAGLVWFARHGDAIFNWAPLHSLLMSRLGLLIVLVLIYLSMAWVVTRMIARDGNAYASVFSRFLGSQESQRTIDKPATLKLNHSSPWLQTFLRITQWVALPWMRYSRYFLAHPTPGPSNALARGELGFGPLVHWVTQSSLCFGFSTLLAVVWWLYPNLLLEEGAGATPLTVFYIALVSVACAAISVLEIAGTMQISQGEQRLMLLLPGMPQGNLLSRMLAVRHLRMAFAAWPFATAWALVLPYPDNIAQYVAAFCWGTLPLIPFVIQDWATVRPPSADRAILSLVFAMLMPISAWAALRWLHLPVELLAAIAVGACLLVLRIRWSRLAHFAQALPAGRLA